MSSFRQPIRQDVLAILLASLTFIIITSILAFTRSYMTYGTETDFVGGFVIEAERFLKGEPLELRFHPPLYAMLLGVTKRLVNDWFIAGLIISVLSTIVVLLVNLRFFFALAGRAAAIGTFSFLVASPVFVSYATLTTSDMFFFAAYSLALLLGLFALQSMNRHLWIVFGASIGIALLIRTNAVSLLVFVVLPLLSGESIRKRFTLLLLLLVGISLPLSVWFWYAEYKNMPTTPTLAHVNLALTYFSGGADRISGDVRIPLETQFRSVAEVFLFDPVHIMKTYIKDLVVNAYKIARGGDVVRFPMIAFALPGLFLILKKFPTKEVWFFTLVLVAQLLLINFKAFEDRYYLFLIPWLGAWSGIFVAAVFGRIRSRLVAFSGYSFLAISIAYLFYQNAVITNIANHSKDEEMEYGIQAINFYTPENAVILTRKGHLPFYTGRNRIYIPNLESLDELGVYLSTLDSKNVFLYYGSSEQRTRKQYRAITDPSSRPEWLRLVSNADKHAWYLFEFQGIAI